MAKRTAKNGIHRFQLVLTDSKIEDAELLEWVTNQSDLGFSLKSAIQLMIKNYDKADYKVLVMRMAAKLMTENSQSSTAEPVAQPAPAQRSAMPQSSVAMPQAQPLVGPDYGMTLSLPGVNPVKPSQKGSAGAFLE